MTKTLKTMQVRLHLLSQSNPIVYENVENAYTKDGMYCIWITNTDVVYKYPLVNIFRVTETYVK